MAQSNSDQGPDRAPPDSDRRTGELFGQRIARITCHWAAAVPGAARTQRLGAAGGGRL